jgi:hypothetical protein
MDAAGLRALQVRAVIPDMGVKVGDRRLVHPCLGAGNNDARIGFLLDVAERNAFPIKTRKRSRSR